MLSPGSGMYPAPADPVCRRSDRCPCRCQQPHDISLQHILPASHKAASDTPLNISDRPFLCRSAGCQSGSVRQMRLPLACRLPQVLPSLPVYLLPQVFPLLPVCLLLPVHPLQPMQSCRPASTSYQNHHNISVSA